MRILFLLSLTILMWCTSCTSTTSDTLAVPVAAAKHLEATQAKFIPDRRVNRLDVDISPQSGRKLLLLGETTLPEAKEEFIQGLLANNYEIVDSITSLPSTELGNHTWGLVSVSVANLRSKPGHSQEMASQVLLGTPIRLLKKQAEWYMVQVPDGYIAWLNRGEFVSLTLKELTDWKKSTRLVYAPTYGHAYQSASLASTPYSDLVAGAVLQKLDVQGGMTQVRLPDGNMAFVSTQELVAWDKWVAQADNLRVTDVEALGKNLLGVPYLWGGTSTKGMDCSGFTKMIYWQQGVIIPRDASQQVHAGSPVTYDEKLDGLIAGDFLFFGRYRDDGSPKVTHVGIYLGEGHFIHSGADNGSIRIQSLLPDHPDFAAHRRASLLSARRLAVGNTGVKAVATHEWYE